jgi:hypothetical protein
MGHGAGDAVGDGAATVPKVAGVETENNAPHIGQALVGREPVGQIHGERTAQSMLKGRHDDMASWASGW